MCCFIILASNYFFNYILKLWNMSVYVCDGVVLSKLALRKSRGRGYGKFPFPVLAASALKLCTAGLWRSWLRFRLLLGPRQRIVHGLQNTWQETTTPAHVETWRSCFCHRETANTIKTLTWSPVNTLMPWRSDPCLLVRLELRPIHCGLRCLEELD